MTVRFNLRPTDHLSNPDDKLELNKQLFDEVAPRYDFITKALSFGRDSAWKKAMISLLPKLENPTCLDLACGTGDVTRLIAKHEGFGSFNGLDLTPAMLKIAKERTMNPYISYQEGNMNGLPYKDNTIDIVTGSYALRNAPDLPRALSEIHRVMKPGATAAFLDFSKPRNGTGQAITHALLKFWGGFWGLALHGNADVCGYIADSLKSFPDRPTIRQMIQEQNMTLVSSKKCFFGILEILILKK